MTENVKLQKKILKRVTRMYYLRKVINPVGFKVFAFGIGFVGVVSLVSIKNVFANMPALFDIVGVYYFSKYAFVNTEFAVQLTLITVLGFGLWLVRDIVRNTTGGQLHLSRI